MEPQFNPQYIDGLPEPGYLEVSWVKLRPRRLPRSVICVAAVYSPPNDDHGEDLIQYLLRCMDILRTKYQSAGFIILGCSDCRRCGSTQPGCLSCLRGLASSGKRSSPELMWPSYGFLSSPHHQKGFFSRYADMEYGNFKSQKKESQLTGLRLRESPK
ncbi:uncharacterized protein LOC135153650 [Lytechinus pictus]|uniref:uncharacterized protein LOC135153650 n=1 Tax=Lytechinus pictus TaxID=7653 RepID=UPI0030B9BF52